MTAEKPINKPLIFVSFVVLILYAVTGSMYNRVSTAEVEHPIIGAIMTTLAIFLLAPFIVLWLKALWNEIVPRITPWRNITYLEAFALFTLHLFLTTSF